MTETGLTDLDAYQFEAFEAETIDGYILTIFRLRADENGDVPDNFAEGGPVIFVHGFGANAICYLHRDHDDRDSLPITLFKAGKDIYFSNQRGSRFSRNHVNKDISHAEFWDFEREEVGTRDLPAIVDAVIAHSGKNQKVKLVTHSAGGENAFRMMLKVPDTDKKVQAVAAFAPALVVHYIMRLMAPLINTPQEVSGLANKLREMGIYAFFDSKWYESVNKVCSKTSLINLCLQMQSMNPLSPGEGEVSVKYFESFAQSSIAGVYQEYVDPDIFALGGDNVYGKAFDLSEISDKIDIYGFMPTEDAIVNTDKVISLFTEELDLDEDHIYPHYASHFVADNNTPEVEEQLLNALSEDPEPVETSESFY